MCQDSPMNSTSQIYDSNELRSNFYSRLVEIYEYRQVIYLLVQRDITLRYKRSVIGVGWSLLNPLLMTAVLYFVFNAVFAGYMNRSEEYLPYLLSGILTITFFNQGLQISAEAISSARNMVTKIYIPAEVLVISSVVVSTINFTLGLIPLGLISILVGKGISVTFPLTLLFIAMLAIYISGLALFVSITFVRFRDTRSLLPVLLTALTYLSPVFYPKEILNPNILNIVQLNPMVSFLDLLRWSFNQTSTVSIFDWIYAPVVTMFICYFGIKYFRKSWPKTLAML